MWATLRDENSRELQSQGGPHNTVCFTSRSLTRFPQEIVEKNALVLPARGEERGPFLDMSEHSVLFNKACLQERLAILSLICWGAIRSSLTWGKRNPQSSQL